MLTHQLTLKASGRKPPELGPKVRIETAHLSPAADEAGLAAIVNGAGLRDWDKDGLLEHDTAAKNMWRGPFSPNPRRMDNKPMFKSLLDQVVAKAE